MQSLTSSILAVPSTFLAPTTTTAKQSLLQPHDGAPLTGETELIPPKYTHLVYEKDKDREKGFGTPPLSPHSRRGSSKDLELSQGITTALSPAIIRTDLPTFTRAPPSQLLDAPARAALNMPNQMTAHGQARAVRGDPRTPEYEVDGLGAFGAAEAGLVGAGSKGPVVNAQMGTGQQSQYGSTFQATVHDASSGEATPLIAPQPRYAGRSGSSTEDYLSGGSNYLSAHGIGSAVGAPAYSDGGFDGSGEGSSTGHNISRPSSAQSTSSSRNILRRIFIDRSSTPSQHLSRPTFPPPSASSYSPRPPGPLSISARINLFISQGISVALSTVFLAFVVSWAMAGETARKLPTWVWPGKGKSFPWDDDKYWKKEGRKVSKDPRDYARQVGMDIEHQVVETEDGYLLKMHKVIDPTHKPLPNGKPPFPVLILHGLFQSSGSFVTSEERSLAFWLARQGGYSVYLGNTRGVFDMGHRNLSRGDPRFWDWTIRELAMYDLPALVEHVCRETGYDKIAFIGHSQGNGLAFISLSLGMCPNLGKKLSCFIALAPAVYAGPLTTGFPFTALNRLEWATWKRLFGVLDFIPLMRWAYDWAPAKLFAMLGYTMFAFLFSWTDANWLHRRKTKMFRFTPTPVSSASIFWWCGKGGFADRKCTLDDSLERWFDARFPPLSIYYGGRDYLVLTEPLLERLERKEREVRVLKVTKLEESEHCDFYWAAEAVEWAYESFVDDIERTRPKDDEEQQTAARDESQRWEEGARAEGGSAGWDAGNGRLI